MTLELRRALTDTSQWCNCSMGVRQDHPGFAGLCKLGAPQTECEFGYFVHAVKAAYNAIKKCSCKRDRNMIAFFKRMVPLFQIDKMDSALYTTTADEVCPSYASLFREYLRSQVACEDIGSLELVPAKYICIHIAMKLPPPGAVRSEIARRNKAREAERAETVRKMVEQRRSEIEKAKREAEEASKLTDEQKAEQAETLRKQQCTEILDHNPDEPDTPIAEPDSDIDDQTQEHPATDEIESWEDTDDEVDNSSLIGVVTNPAIEEVTESLNLLRSVKNNIKSKPKTKKRENILSVVSNCMKEIYPVLNYAQNSMVFNRKQPELASKAANQTTPFIDIALGELRDSPDDPDVTADAVNILEEWLMENDKDYFPYPDKSLTGFKYRTRHIAKAGLQLAPTCTNMHKMSVLLLSKADREPGGSE